MCGKCQSVLAQKHLQYELDVEKAVIEPIQEILDVSLPDSWAQIILNTRSNRDRSGSVVECLTRDQGAAGSSLTSITVLCP